VLQVSWGYRDVDISKDALLRWLEKGMGTRVWFRFDEVTEVVKQLATLSGVKEAPDAATLLAVLSQPERLGLPADITTRLRDSEWWHTLIDNAQLEWNLRHYWLDKLPFLPAAIAQVEEFLSAPDPALSRAAACALARLYQGDDDRPSHLQDLLLDDPTVLRALLDASADEVTWIDEGEARVSQHTSAVKQIVGWLETKTPEDRTRLIDSMLDGLDKALGMTGENGNIAPDVYRGWAARRMLAGTLAELSERMTYRAFTNTRDLPNVITLFTRAASDKYTHDLRRFAIRILGNLQHLTDEVADVFFAACQDLSVVYRETRAAVTKFKVFGAGSLERLTAAIHSPSITVAYHAALLLAELGISRSEDLGHEGRQRVANELVQLLDDPLADRIVYDFSKSNAVTRVGPLYDIIYGALVRVVAGPDAPENVAAQDEEIFT
jgi:hypothetical protein